MYYSYKEYRGLDGKIGVVVSMHKDFATKTVKTYRPMFDKVVDKMSNVVIGKAGNKMLLLDCDLEDTVQTPYD